MTDIEIDAILFDKDGTLIDFTDTWLPLYRAAAEYIAAQCDNPSLASSLLESGGYLTATATWKPDSVLASGSNRQIFSHWQSHSGIEFTNEILDRLGEILGGEIHIARTVIQELPAYMESLCSAGYQIGVATMDDELSALCTLEKLGISNYLTFVCGADSGFGVKPEPGMLTAFCEACETCPDRVAMIGDSPRDLIMAKNSNAALSVGVLTGASRAEDLIPYADYILNNIGEVPELLHEISKKKD